MRVPFSRCSSCDRIVYARGLCANHYQLWRESRPDRVCAEDGCERGVKARGLCSKHYQRMRQQNASEVKRWPGYGAGCDVQGCERPVHANGLCNMHLLRARLRGDHGPAEAERVHGEVWEKFWPKVDKGGPIPEGGDTPCWLWTASLNDSGYGSFNGPQPIAHRMAWALTKGDLTPDMTLHHVCGIKSCVNPDHLVEVTNRENVIESLRVKALEAKVARLEAEVAELRAQLKEVA